MYDKSVEEEDGASMSQARRNRKEKRAKRKARKQKYGRGKKGRDAERKDIAVKAARATMESLGADDGTTGTDGKAVKISDVGNAAAGKVGIDAGSIAADASGSSMNNISMSVPAKKIMSIQKMSQGTRPKYDNVQGSSMYKKNKMGASMYRNNMDGSSMNAYQDKEASMDDYSHEKKLKSDGRYEAAHGKMANAKNDFDHAHALKKDAKHDAKGRSSVMKHMRGFK